MYSLTYTVFSLSHSIFTARKLNVMVFWEASDLRAYKHEIALGVALHIPATLPTSTLPVGCGMPAVVGSVFSLADRDTNNAKGTSHRHIVK